VASGDLILMGPPGSGKGTQARLLAQTPGWVHVSTGDLFRENVSKGTPLGNLADVYMSKGEYVPDDLTVGMVRERLRTIAPGDRIAFDGFPRTVAQAEALEALLRERGRRISGVVLIDCTRDEVTARLIKRGQGRADDSPEVIGKRFDVYEEQTRPVVEHYERKDLVKRVNGIGPVDEISGRLKAAIG
jgi:adenylate kinase